MGQMMVAMTTTMIHLCPGHLEEDAAGEEEVDASERPALELSSSKAWLV